jgi:hypothetical protein
MNIIKAIKYTLKHYIDNKIIIGKSYYFISEEYADSYKITVTKNKIEEHSWTYIKTDYEKTHVLLYKDEDIHYTLVGEKVKIIDYIIDIEYTIDLSIINDINIPNNKKKLIIINASDDNFNKLKIPEYIEEIEINGSLKSLKLPDHLKCVTCSYLNLENLYLGDELEYLFCFNNNLKTITLPDNILTANFSHNKLEEIKAKNELKRIEFLDISYNNIHDFDLKLPNTMGYFFMENNPDDFKIKYAAFLVYDSGLVRVIDGDFDKEDKLLCNEYLRGRLEELCRLEYEYIDINKLEDDDYYFNLVNMRQN